MDGTRTTLYPPPLQHHQQKPAIAFQPPVGSLRKKPDRRKPAKHVPMPSKSPPEEEEQAHASKRARKLPSWLQSTFDDLPTQTEQEQLEQQEQQQRQVSPDKNRGVGRPSSKATKAVNWRLLDQENVVVEIDYNGQRYRGVLERTGPGNVGHVQEEYHPSTAPTTSSSTKESRELCALCNLSLTQHQAGVEEELQKVVRVQVSSMWLAHVHLSCGLWAPEVYEDREGNLTNIASAIRRSRGLRCHKCHQRGACVGCYQPGCSYVFHLPCARTGGCEVHESDYQLYCPAHAAKRDLKRRHT